MTRFDLATPLVGGTLGGKLKSGGKLTTAARSYLTHSAKLASLPPPFRHARQTGTLSQLASLPHPRRVSSGKLSAQHSGSLAGTMKYQDHPGAFDASRGGLAPTVPAEGQAPPAREHPGPLKSANPSIPGSPPERNPRMRRRATTMCPVATPGPHNCMRVPHYARQCDICGATPPVLHTPIRAAGRYCAACCPHCTSASLRKAGAHSTSINRDGGDR